MSLGSVRKVHKLWKPDLLRNPAFMSNTSQNGQFRSPITITEKQWKKQIDGERCTCNCFFSCASGHEVSRPTSCWINSCFISRRQTDQVITQWITYQLISIKITINQLIYKRCQQRSPRIQNKHVDPFLDHDPWTTDQDPWTTKYAKTRNLWRTVESINYLIK